MKGSSYIAGVHARRRALFHPFIQPAGRKGYTNGGKFAGENERIVCIKKPARRITFDRPVKCLTCYLAALAASAASQSGVGTVAAENPLSATRICSNPS